MSRYRVLVGRRLVAGVSFVDDIRSLPDSVRLVVQFAAMGLQLVVSLGFIYLCPDTVFAHWMYLIGATVVLAVAYVLYKRKYYWMHEEYLKGLRK